MKDQKLKKALEEGKLICFANDCILIGEEKQEDSDLIDQMDSLRLQTVGYRHYHEAGGGNQSEGNDKKAYKLKEEQRVSSKPVE